MQEIKQQIFDGLLLREDLESLEQYGISTSHELTATAEPEDAPDFSPSLVYQAQQMADLYRVFYCLENDVRSVIKERLSSLYGTDWFPKQVPKKIRDEVDRLKKKEEKNKYHVQRSGDEIGYTMFGNLAQIIVANWVDFEDLFPDQAWVTSRFKDLELSRNIIMHTNALPNIEIERIYSIVRDWKSQVG